MEKGIYITANDKVTEQTIALLNSIRAYDTQTPIILIPYDDNHQAIAALLKRDYGVEVFGDLDFIDRLSRRLQQTFGEDFFARPNQFRKQACWFGPFEKFLYIDTDIVVFDQIIKALDYLDTYDFICYDYQHAGGIRNVFSQNIIEQNVFTEAEVGDLFNCGFWGAKRDLMTEQNLYDTFQECAAHPEYFDFSEKTSDQPIINYMILKQVPKRFNIAKRTDKAPGSWAGSKHFVKREDGRLVDTNCDQAIDYLHWAGIRIQPGCPYWDVWKHYRYLRSDTVPADPPQKKPAPPTVGQQLRRSLSKLKQQIK